jgi:arylsulfatase A
LALYNLESDVGETQDVSAEHPDVVARLEKLAQAAREDLGDTLTKWKGKNVRPPGKL